MAYIIENANLVKGQARSVTSLLVEAGKIVAANPSFSRYKFMRMVASDYFMSPVHVLLDSNLPLNQPFHERKDYYIKNFILKGSTAVLTSIKILSVRELEMRVKQARSSLSDCPVDYIIGIRFSSSLLDPALIRKCKREKIPALFIEIESADELYRIPWGWIKEALFPYNCPLIPVFPECGNRKERQRRMDAWKELIERTNVTALSEELPERYPLSGKALKKTGIFPLKASLHNGSELSYNFYRKRAGFDEVVDMDLYFDHSHDLLVTVHKGKVIRAGSDVYYRPGSGEDVIIKTPGYFSDPD